jgi:hypothetical protein
MNRLFLFTMLLLAGLASAARAQSGGPYEITSWTIDGGGVVNATGGSYTLSGTIGQPDAGPRQSGGAFDLDGGFWPAAIEVVSCPADLAAPFGVLNIFDIQVFIQLYNAQDPAADLAAPFGAFNIFDIQSYIGLYNQGCP